MELLMQQTIFTILTNEKARTPEALIANLDKDFRVGAPWLPGIILATS
jgi:hypothetical protein